MDSPILPFSDQGQGPAVLFIHGFLENRTMWDRIIQALSQNYRCITVDLPGHGENSSMSQQESLFNMAEKMAGLLDHLNISDCICVGHSLGGYVGAEIALGFPSKLKKLILLNSHCDKDTDEKKDNRTRAEILIENKYESFVKEAIPNLFYKKNAHLHQTEISNYIQAACQLNKNHVILCSMAMKKRPSYKKGLQNFNGEIVFICGDNDPIMPLSKVKDQYKFIPGSSLAVIEDCGHMAHIEQTEALISTLKGHI